ncbi:hypothetical protein DPMN_175609 [Dreissena polymorpha]|uniref:Uncharacterized protein n=1 Tax=Dreissena polymorpha TaxID=45954 RepID=A0A9D4E5H6_DREPO|nr:hypothetical protein DPMN_175609 [Dreissena polymorpha]
MRHHMMRRLIWVYAVCLKEFLCSDVQLIPLCSSCRCVIDVQLIPLCSGCRCVSDLKLIPLCSGCRCVSDLQLIPLCSGCRCVSDLKLIPLCSGCRCVSDVQLIPLCSGCRCVRVLKLIPLCSGFRCVSDVQLIPLCYGCRCVSDVQLIQPLVILLSLVLMPGLLLLLCVVSPCPLASRMWPRRRQSNRERTLEHSHLQPERKSSEVVYVPTPSPSRELLLQHQISQTQQPWGFPARATPCYQGNMLDLPPQIPISKDGEEGYIESQKQLIKNKRKFINDQLVRPPPNKTVHDRESPPPYCSKTTSLENVGNPGNTRIVRDMDGCPRVQRCFSMSVNERTTPTSANGHKDTSKYGQKPTVANTNNRTLSTNLRTEDCPVRTVRHSFTPNIQSDRPPDYEVFCSSDNNNQRSLHVDSV